LSLCPLPLPRGMRRRATRNQTVKKLDGASEFAGSQAFACASSSRERLSRAFQRALCFSGRDTLFRSSAPSTTFCKFLCSLRLWRTPFRTAPALAGRCW